MVAALLVLAPMAAGSPAGAVAGNAVFVDANGAFISDFGFSGPCNGSVTVSLTINRPTGVDHRSVAAVSTMVPDLCGIGCLDCPVPFVWTIKGAGVQLAGGGVAGGGWSLQGKFQEGVTEARGLIV
jgi:hypothetical protein